MPSSPSTSTALMTIETSASARVNPRCRRTRELETGAILLHIVGHFFEVHSVQRYSCEVPSSRCALGRKEAVAPTTRFSRSGAVANLVAQLLCELFERHRLLHAVARAHVDLAGCHFRLADHEHVGRLLQLMGADFLLQALVGVVHRYAEAR